MDIIPRPKAHNKTPAKIKKNVSIEQAHKKQTSKIESSNKNSVQKSANSHVEKVKMQAAAKHRAARNNVNLRKQREKVLSEGKKLIYPLRHTKHRIALISIALGLLVIFATAGSIYYGLYVRQSQSDLVHRFTKIFPVRVGKIGGTSVRYEEYLFELNSATYYLETYENVDFSSEEGQERLAAVKEQVRDKLVLNTTIKQLAQEHNIEVGDEEIDQEIEEFRRKHGIQKDGDSKEDDLESTIKKVYNWSIEDFRRELELQLLRKKLVAALEPGVMEEAKQALSELEAGADFKEVAKKYTDDNGTKPTGGEFPDPINRDNSDLPSKLLNTGFELEEGAHSQIIQTFFPTNEGRNVVALHIVRNNENIDNDSKRIAHIMFLYDSFDNLAKEKIESNKNNIDLRVDLSEKDE